MGKNKGNKVRLTEYVDEVSDKWSNHTFHLVSKPWSFCCAQFLTVHLCLESQHQPQNFCYKEGTKISTSFLTYISLLTFYLCTFWTFLLAKSKKAKQQRKLYKREKSQKSEKKKISYCHYVYTATKYFTGVAFYTFWLFTTFYDFFYFLYSSLFWKAYLAFVLLSFHTFCKVPDVKQISIATGVYTTQISDSFLIWTNFNNSSVHCDHDSHALWLRASTGRLVSMPMAWLQWEFYHCLPTWVNSSWLTLDMKASVGWHWPVMGDETPGQCSSTIIKSGQSQCTPTLSNTIQHNPLLPLPWPHSNATWRLPTPVNTCLCHPSTINSWPSFSLEWPDCATLWGTRYLVCRWYIEQGKGVVSIGLLG